MSQVDVLAKHLYNIQDLQASKTPFDKLPIKEADYWRARAQIAIDAGLWERFNNPG